MVIVDSDADVQCFGELLNQEICECSTIQHPISEVEGKISSLHPITHLGTLNTARTQRDHILESDTDVSSKMSHGELEENIEREVLVSR